MAHSCPVCAMQCYCGGDIDDICRENSKYEELCSCCDTRDEDIEYIDDGYHPSQEEL